MKRLVLFLIFQSLLFGCKPFGRYCNLCHKKRCVENSTMIFFNKAKICDSLLYINYVSSNIDTINSNYNNSCGYIPTDSLWKLVGYYIQPKISNLNINGNEFEFRPVWVIENASNIIEEVGFPVVLGNSYESISTSSMPYQVQFPYNAVAIPNNGGFNHNIFMYNHLAIADTFTKAFISRHELLLITNSSDYVGIGGGLVVTDNLAVGNPDYRNYFNRTCYKEYFTYRFVGFKKQQVPPNPPTSEYLYLLKNGYDKAMGNGYNPAIPTETWAVPCPPMWDPTDD